MGVAWKGPALGAANSCGRGVAQVANGEVGVARWGQLGQFSCGWKRKRPTISGAPRAGGHVAAAGAAQRLWLVPWRPVGCGPAPSGSGES